MQWPEGEDGRRGAARRAAETAWIVYRASHRGTDVQDGRRCLLERHLQDGTLNMATPKNAQAPARLSAPASSGRMLREMKMLLGRVARGGTRPIWTLLAISCIISGAIVIALRCAFGE